jgi:hypothetical protein
LLLMQLIDNLHAWLQLTATRMQPAGPNMQCSTEQPFKTLH